MLIMTDPHFRGREVKRELLKSRSELNKEENKNKEEGGTEGENQMVWNWKRFAKA